MKKRFLFLLSLVFIAVSTAFSQQQQAQHLPIDPAVRMGTLPNGMKYYIYKNDKPKGLADFYIIHNVGAMQEDDNQNGLAHFLEHMAFNGTVNLPGKMLLDYFQANGVEFGRDINAMTGMDNTQYLITNVPMAREGIIDTAIMAIADWSGGVALLDKEIDNERGVILEEKRTGNNTNRRMQEQFFPFLFNNSKYAQRNVIGTEEILKNFKYSDIKDFYHKWYRPDLQAVIVAGDIDVDMIEAKIKKVMGAIPAQKNPAHKEEVFIKPYEKDDVCIVTDKENTSNMAMLMSILPANDKSLNDTPQKLLMDLCGAIVTTVMSERLSDIAKQADAPFLGASFGKQALSANHDAISQQVATKEGGLPTGIEALQKEITRLRKFGVTDSEVERVKLNIMKSIETSFANRADRKTGSIVADLIENYTNNAPILTPEMSYTFYKTAIGQIKASILNELLPVLFPELPTGIIVLAPQKEGVAPTKEAILTAYTAGKNAQVEAPKQETLNRPLIEKEPKAGKIKKETTDKMGNTVWTLSNGAKVIIKNTDFRADEIIMSGSRVGGNNMVSDDKILSANLVDAMIQMSGLGTFSSSELSKVLSGKMANVGKSLSTYSHGVGGRSSNKDIETMMQLLYLSYTAQPMLQKDYDLLISNLKSKLNGIEEQPNFIFGQKAKKVLYGDNKRNIPLTNETIKNVSLEDIKSIHNMIFDGVDGMNFIFVGSVDKTTLKPLVEKYIASLPKGKAKNENPTSLKLAKGTIKESFPIKQESPKVTFSGVFYTDDIKDVNLKTNISASLLNDILQVRYTKSIREEMGATYGVGTDVSSARVPQNRITVNISFDTNEEKLADAGAQVRKEIEEIANGASIAEDLEIARGAKVKNFEKTVVSSNSAWLGYIASFYKYNENIPAEYLEIIKSITEKDIQELAKKILASGNDIQIVMTPAK